MIKSMVTLFTTLKVKPNGRFCHLLPAHQSTFSALSFPPLPSAENLTRLQPL